MEESKPYLQMLVERQVVILLSSFAVVIFWLYGGLEKEPLKQYLCFDKSRALIVNVRMASSVRQSVMISSHEKVTYFVTPVYPTKRPLNIVV